MWIFLFFWEIWIFEHSWKMWIFCHFWKCGYLGILERCWLFAIFEKCGYFCHFWKVWIFTGKNVMPFFEQISNQPNRKKVSMSPQKGNWSPADSNLKWDLISNIIIKLLILINHLLTACGRVKMFTIMSIKYPKTENG